MIQNTAHFGLLPKAHAPSRHTDKNADIVTKNALGAYNLPQGWYLRSSATWNFAFARDAWSIPIGAGAGEHDGAGQPKFQVFKGLNLRFPLARK